MSCPVTLSGILLGCKNSIGGVKRVYILNKDNLLTPPIFDNAGVINTLVYDYLDLFVYDFRKQTALMTSTESQTDANDTHYYTTDLALKFNKMESAKALEINKLAKGELICFVEDNNGKFWYLGYDDGVTLFSSVGLTGVNFGDRNGYEITLQDISKKLPFETYSATNTDDFIHFSSSIYGLTVQDIENILYKLENTSKINRTIDFTIITSPAYSLWTQKAKDSAIWLMESDWTIIHN